ncbi:serine hydrolase domain-containing protein [Actinomadura roseirufa]|uniref:serine hydrolase domain-containing protein n=1 Tax=Actinomadura roseirufa TaxID=2094049 RepID=UPI001041ABF7|nr:serine hydrolase domain-containing protein [Actinomadura roseirufa]
MNTFSRSRRKAVVGAGAVVLLAVAAGRAEAAPPGTSLQRDVNAIRAAGVVGVVAEASTPAGRIEARAGVADLRTGRPVPRGAHFRGGSNTKTYVATVVLQLVAEGRLGLDDTVDTWLPGLVRGNGNDGTKITVRHLLQHTSGLYDYAYDLPIRGEEDFQEHRFDRVTPEHLVGLALRHRPGFEPGETGPGGKPRWSYSNTGYVLAGMIIRKVTGRTWEREAGRRIVAPLHLSGTSFPDRERGLPRPFVRGYQQFAVGGPLVDATEMDMSWASSAGSLVTTAADHNRFFRALLGGRLLRPAQLAEMQRTVPTGDGDERYGLGLSWHSLSCSKAGYWNHGGDALGYSTREGVSPDGRRGIALSLTTRRGSDDPEKAAVATIQNFFCGR